MNMIHDLKKRIIFIKIMRNIGLVVFIVGLVNCLFVVIDLQEYLLGAINLSLSIIGIMMFKETNRILKVYQKQVIVEQ